MKPLVGVIAVVGVALANWQKPASDPWTLVLTGDYRGQLSPCGCTKPMMGGIRRAATALRSISSREKTLLLANGSLSGESGTQQEFKAQALAESLRQMGVDAINLANDDLRLGAGILGSVNSLSGEKLITSSVGESPTVNHLQVVRKGPFTVFGIPKSANAAATTLFARASDPGPAIDEARHAIVMIDGGLVEAKNLVREHVGIGVIVYRTPDNAPDLPIKSGNTWLVTPGVEGKSLISLRYDQGEFSGYLVTNLGPSFDNDATVSRFYAAYLKRVNDAKLFERISRPKSTTFSGTTESCIKCHVNAGKVWRKSAHAGALKSLEAENHDRDPDCVSCHVVGLDSVAGFRSRRLTPNLANVGCESCHGSAVAHSAAPRAVKLPKVGATACLPCHNAEHSPNFNFTTFFNKISHH